MNVMKIRTYLLVLSIMMLSFSLFGQNVCYFKVVDFENGERVKSVLVVPDSKSMRIEKMEDGIFKVLNLKNKHTITFSAKNYEPYSYLRPKKRYEVARDIFDEFVLHDNDTLTIQLLPEAYLYQKRWEAEDLAYGPIDTTGCVKNPDTFPSLKDTASFMSELQGRIIYPDHAMQMGAQGRVYIGAVIEPDGSLTNVHLFRGIDPFLDRAALRAVRESNFGKLEPAKKNGESVRHIVRIPITFTIN
ncbi:MAG: TonB family protein [Crocinitomicaceae bacterium]|jgi:TonB family protein